MRLKQTAGWLAAGSVLVAILAFQNCAPPSVHFANTEQSSTGTSTPLVTTATWSPAAWSACSVECGVGSQTRKLACVGPDGKTLSDQMCKSVPAPTTTQSCSPLATGTCVAGGLTGQKACDATGRLTCVVPTQTANWVGGTFGACSATCGGGTQTRVNQCVAVGTGQVTGASSCSAAAEPTRSQSCNQQACPMQPCSNSLTRDRQCATAEGSPNGANDPGFKFLAFAPYAQCRALCRDSGSLCTNFVVQGSSAVPNDATTGSCSCHTWPRTVPATGVDNTTVWGTILCPTGP